MALFEEVTFSIRFDAVKHHLWQDANESVDDYVRERVNRMTPCELLQAISDALEHSLRPSIDSP